MIPVILCGGSGSRLWPLSRRMMPKQFIDFPGGNLLYRTLKRVSAMDADHSVLVCAKSHRFFVTDAIAETGLHDRIAVLMEPVMRDTAPAIALAALHILENFGDQPMLVLPSDHIIQDEAAFNSKVAEAVPIAAAGKLLTFGITPDTPHTGYGYIQRGEPLTDGAYAVNVFHEKPDIEEARQRVSSGDCYWNSGMFLFNARVYLDLLAKLEPEIFAACEKAYADRDDIEGCLCADKAAFESSPRISVDYAIMEKSVDLSAVMPVDVGWDDVGSWEALGKLFAGDEHGNRLSGDVVLRDSDGNIVYSSKKLVSLLGIKNCVVVETPDVVLVADKSELQNIKPLVNDLAESGREEAEHNLKVFRPWGTFEQIDSGERFQVKRIVVNPGQILSLQEHRRRAEHWVVVEGRARVTVGDKTFFLEGNQSVYIPKNTKHRLENCEKQPLFLIEVQCGDYLGEDDIIRYEDIYGRLEEKPDV